jgi:hypothetical protein
MRPALLPLTLLMAWTLACGGILPRDDEVAMVELRPVAQPWSYETGGGVYSSPTVSGGTVYVGSSDDHLYALDAKSGSVQWSYETGGNVGSSPTVSGGMVYVGSYDNHLYALDAKTGASAGADRTIGAASSNPDAGEGVKAKKEEGKVGKKDAKMEKAKGNKVEIQKKELDREIAENQGILGALAGNADLDGMFGTSGLDANLTGGIGGLIGAKGTQIGSGGLGARGPGLGGGGTAEGLGGLGTKRMGSGASGYGAGGGSFGAKGAGGTGVVGGDAIILGALDRSLIDEVIKRHMNQIRYCYQRELTNNPALGGKIVMKFVIAKDGTVSSASKETSSMNNAGVENCVAGRFMRMQFPEPKGGGIVIVSYPFVFTPG